MGYHTAPLEVRKVTGGWNSYPPSTTTGDDLNIYANQIDTTTKITLEGGGNLNLVPNSNILFASWNGYYFTFYGDATNSDIMTIANQNIRLLPHGTGKVAFGTHTGSGDVACNGSIAILDGGGTPRKIMTTA